MIDKDHLNALPNKAQVSPTTHATTKIAIVSALLVPVNVSVRICWSFLHIPVNRPLPIAEPCSHTFDIRHAS